MRILHVTRETSGDRRFGIGRSLQPVLDALAARGHEVRYLTQDDLTPRALAAHQRFAALGERWGPVLFGPAGRAHAMVWAERLNMGRLAAKLAAREGWDIVHLHDPWIAWAFRQASRWYRGARRARWGFSEHGFGCYAEATREEGLLFTEGMLQRLRRLERRIAARADFVVCPTEAGRHQLARDFACLEPPAHWHAVPHARPALALPGREAARAQLGWAGDRPQVVAVGRINPVKRLEAIVRACSALRRPLRLTLLAAGDAAPLYELARDAQGLELDVRCVDDVAPYLAAADVYVSAALNESFGIANLEAMCAGLPCICTAVGGVPEVTGGAAWLVPGASDGLEQRLAHALRTLLDNPALARQGSEQARRRAGAWPDADAVAARHEAIYRALV